MPEEEIVKQPGQVTEQGKDVTSTATDQQIPPVVDENAGNLKATDVDLDPFIDPKKTLTQKEPPKDETQKEEPGKETASTEPAKQESPTNPPPAWEGEKTALLSKITELENKAAAVLEYEKDPYGFVAKYMPHFAQKTFDPIGYVAEQLDKKYNRKNELGETIEFTPDPAKALKPGTADYNYMQDMRKFEAEAQHIIDTAGQSIDTANSQAQVALETAKKGVMTKYGLTPDAFAQKIWSVLENVGREKALELMADGIMLAEKIATIQGNSKNGVDLASAPPSVTDISVAEVKPDKEMEEIEDLFGKDYVRKALSNN